MSSIVILALTEQGELDGGSVQRLLVKLDVPGLDSEEAYIGISAALSFYKMWEIEIGEQVDRSIYLRPVLASIAHGINIGIGMHSRGQEVPPLPLPIQPETRQ